MRKRIAVLDEILEPLARELEPTDYDRKDQLWKRIAASFRPALALMKHDGFHEEREWRLVRTLSKSGDSRTDWPAKVRAIRGKLVPYMPISWPSTTVLMRRPAIKEIYCGPSADAQLEEKVLRDLLDGEDCRRTLVIPSGIPLRV